jgi:hypothetical protein
MEVVDGSKSTAGEGKKAPSLGALRLDLQKNVNSSLRRCRATDGSFR